MVFFGKFIYERLCWGIFVNCITFKKFKFFFVSQITKKFQKKFPTFAATACISVLDIKCCKFDAASSPTFVQSFSVRCISSNSTSVFHPKISELQGFSQRQTVQNYTKTSFIPEVVEDLIIDSPRFPRKFCRLMVNT